ncbi:MAG: pantetheine-phosphate adenylyltransferase [Bacteroidaceae bacterium]|nr:pantetheine-phosphate adenylyltransferase [Bacteroidaceae bacterium]
MKLFFAGSFDPYTIGHHNIVQRALAMGFEVVVGIGVNTDKTPSCSIEERLDSIRRIYSANDSVSVVAYSGLSVKAAVQAGATALLRGVRTLADYEYERSLAQINRDISGMETVLLFSEPEYEHVSSSMVRELEKYGQSVDKYIVK